MRNKKLFLMKFHNFTSGFVKFRLYSCLKSLLCIDLSLVWLLCLCILASCLSSVVALEREPLLLNKGPFKTNHLHQKHELLSSFSDHRFDRRKRAIDTGNLYSKPCVALGYHAHCATKQPESLLDCDNVQRTPPVTLAKLLANLSPIIRFLSIDGDVDLSTQGLPVWEEMVELNISNSCVNSIDSRFLDHFPRLATLKVVKARLQTLPVFSHPHSGMRHLILNENEIQQWSAASLLSMPELHSLHLASNRISRLSAAAFPSRSNLRELNLHNNAITQIEDAVASDRLTNLLVLRLSRNKLKEAFPGDAALQHRAKMGKDTPLPNFTTVHTLDLSRNELEFIPPVLFGYWKQLRVLKLRRNKLEFFGAGAFYIYDGGLHQLDLAFNKVDLVTPEVTYGLDLLERLQLQNNRVRSVQPGALEKLRALRHLDLRFNKLSFLSGVLQPLPSLETLRLDSNPLHQLAHGSFSSLHRLKQLDLASCGIHVIDEQVFEAQNQLHSLDLQDNKLTMLRGGFFRGLVRLESLNLLGNNITGVEESENNDLQSMIFLTNFKMRTSHFHCGLCSLKPFLSWIRGKGFTKEKIAVTCSSPESHKGRELLSLHNEQLDCQLGLSPKLMAHPSSEEKLVGENLTLSCTILSSVRPLVIWEKAPLLSGTRDTPQQMKSDDIERTGSEWKARLRVLRLQLNDAGRYRCSVSVGGTATRIRSLSAEIRVLQPPMFTARPAANYQARAGSTLTIPCAAVGFPLPEHSLRSMRRAQAFPAAVERRLKVLSGNTSGFSLLLLKPADSGTYLCAAENAAGRVQAPFNLTVLTTPVFTAAEWPAALRVTKGQPFALDCAASAVPNPQRAFWWRNEVLLNITAAQFSVPSAESHHSGTYRCSQHNSEGSVSRSTTVTVSSGTETVSNQAAPSFSQMTFAIVISAVVCVLATTFLWAVVFVILKRRARRQVRRQVKRTISQHLAGSRLLNNSCTVPVDLESKPPLPPNNKTRMSLYKSEPSLVPGRRGPFQVPTETSDYNTGSECSSSAERLQYGLGLGHSFSMQCSLNYSTVQRCTSFTGQAVSPDSGCEASSLLTGSSRSRYHHPRRPHLTPSVTCGSLRLPPPVP